MNEKGNENKKYYWDSDSDWIFQDASKLFAKNKKRSMSAMFRRFRKYRHFSLFGDYVLLAGIVDALKILKIEKSHKTFLRASNQSKEYSALSGSDKRKWIKNLVKDRSNKLTHEGVLRPDFAQQGVSNVKGVYNSLFSN